MAPPPPPTPATHPTLDPTKTPKRLSPQSIQSALKTLKKWISTNTSPASSSDPIFLVITLKKTPSKGPTKAHLIPLPHPVPSSKLCLIVKDGLALEEVKTKIVAEEGASVSRVIGVKELKDELNGNDARRKLCDGFDVFCVDKGVSDVVNGLLGKCFYKKKKVPVPVEMEGEGWEREIEKVLGSAMLFLGNGTCSAVKVARVGMEEDEVVENVIGVVDGVVEVVGGWEEVRSLHLKLSASVAVPVYQNVVAVGVVKKQGDGKVSAKKKNEKKGKERKRGKASKGVDESSRKKSVEVSEKGSDDDDEAYDIMDSGVDELVGAKFSGEFSKRKRKRGGKGDEEPENVSEGDDTISNRKSKKKGSKKKRIHEIHYIDSHGEDLVDGHDMDSNAPGKNEKNKKNNMDESKIKGGIKKKSKNQAKQPPKTKKEKTSMSKESR